jgi:hypothetical protein
LTAAGLHFYNLALFFLQGAAVSNSDESYPYESNPYQSPQFVGQATAVDPVDREKLRRVARRQKWVLYALLAQVAVFFLLFPVTYADQQGPIAVLSLTFWALAIASMVAIFRLAKEVASIALAVICTLFMLMPCISLITLLVINGRATKLLQEHGVKVGFMGANPDLI